MSEKTMVSLGSEAAPVPDRIRSPEMAAAISYVGTGFELSSVRQVCGGKSKLLLIEGSIEAKQFDQVQGIISDYASRDNDLRPLSIAIFGPPGSGKSRWVKTMIGSNERLDLIEINLSQLSDPDRLAKSIGTGMERRAAAVTGESKTVELPDVAVVEASRPKIKAFFFDEFDSPLKDEPLGWLRWFLGLMQDGKFFLDGTPFEIGKAILLFAGGTAVSLGDFEERAQLDQVAYRNRKVPDFISRLRGFVDIQGINEGRDRITRRALVLRALISQRFGETQIDADLVESLLDNVHFIHGVRSMEALLDMCLLGNDPKLTRDHLPGDELKKLHINRGPLDGKTIGISAGLDTKTNGDFLRNLGASLMRNGANLAYGGDFWPRGTLPELINAAVCLPNDIVDGSGRSSGKRIRNYLGFPSFLRDEVKIQINKWKDDPQVGRVFTLTALHTLTSQERKELGVPEDRWFTARPSGPDEEYNPNKHLAWAISLFRMRARLIHDIDALIVLGGKDGESWGRFPGIAEEVMLAIAMRKPVYVLGGSPSFSGGAAREVGRLLGLGEVIANPHSCFEDTGSIGPALDERHAASFALPGNSGLPRTLPELRSYLFEHSVTSSAWPWNGLRTSQNRSLFCKDIIEQTSISPDNDKETIVDLVLLGLARLTWKEH